MRSPRRVLLICFFLSGFASLLYQIVWMRLALARFGVNASIVAIVLAVFMAGLAAGSIAAGWVIDLARRRVGAGPLAVYAAAEVVVAIGGTAVPRSLAAGREALLTAGATDSGTYTLASGLLLALVLLPFCTAMGLTFPAAAAFLREVDGEAGEPAFSALYLANVGGAFAGAIVTPFVLVELFGFVATSLAAAALNLAVAAAAFALSRRSAGASAASPPPAGEAGLGSAFPRAALFVTGFSTMGMEVVWTRIFPTVIGTFVYSFAAIVAIYLVATTAGTALYRRVGNRPRAGRLGTWWPWLCASSLLPLLSASIGLPGAIGAYPRVIAGLAPFCALLGFVTPALVDRWAGNDPRLVGRAYAINLLGCLAGPIAAGFVLLPRLGTRGAALALALPLFALLLAAPIRRDAPLAARLAALAATAGIWFGTTLFEEQFPDRMVRVDHVATVVASGRGVEKNLFVNGVGMTRLTSITKMMAHFPAAHIARAPGRPLDALVICFGMGTSFRSLARWDARVTAVELVPSVTEFFPFYFPDAPQILASGGSALRIVHDDGRRYLDRSRESYDLITVDPPPPVEAAGSSLLYSKQFYESAARRLKPQGVLQVWLPGGDRATIAGATLAALETFPSVRVFSSIYGFGFHLLASKSPIPRLDAGQLVAAMPPAAIADMTEWVHAEPVRFFEVMLRHEYEPESLLLERSRAATVAIQDDRPVNEFYMLRRARGLDAPLVEGATGLAGAASTGGK